VRVLMNWWAKDGRGLGEGWAGFEFARVQGGWKGEGWARGRRGVGGWVGLLPPSIYTYIPCKNIYIENKKKMGLRSPENCFGFLISLCQRRW
jgi:hypothetical protein